MIKLMISALVLTGMLAACNQSPDTANSQNTDSISTSVSVPPQVKDDTTNAVYTHYIHLKDALVATDPAEARMAATELADALAKIDGCKNTSALASNISSTSDIADQRKDFTALSSDVIAMFKHTDITSGNIYVQYCPMANEGEGGYWLASETKIRNPYYGDEMMNCGEVKQTIGVK